MDQTHLTLLENAAKASHRMMLIDDNTRKDVLLCLADLIDDNNEALLTANGKDLSKMDAKNPLYDRLRLTPQRLSDIAHDMRHVATLTSPVGEIVEHRTLPNGLQLRRVRVPYGVIGVIYEARPNVTFDVFSLCFRTGNVCVLKGGSDAACSNNAAMQLIHRALRQCGCPEHAAVMMPPTHEATADMLNATGLIDICIPRGGRGLIDFVRNNARIPVIETGAGVVHTYFDRYGNIDKGKRIICNGKTRRVSVCNALDTLLIDKHRLADLPQLCKPLADKSVEIHADSACLAALQGSYPERLLKKADESVWAREWMDYKMGLRAVEGIEQAIEHIATYGSGHSEAIITDNEANADRFRRSVDAACVYVNAPTSFTDGAQFGLGAEIGISTQKLGPRGPMGLKEITTYKYLIDGDGQIRP